MQAIAGISFTGHGKGGQVRGYLNLRDTLQCISSAETKSPGKGQLRILNQFTETFSVNELAERVQRVAARIGLRIDIQHIDNPRKRAGRALLQSCASWLARTGIAAASDDRRGRSGNA